MKQLLIFSFILSVVYSAKLPNYLKKCKKGPDGSKCIVDNVGNAIINLLKDGEPKFKLSSIKPLHVDKIAMQPSPQLTIVLEDCKFDYLETMKVSEGQIDDKELFLKGHMDRMELTSKYDFNGRILVLPIQGKGPFNLTFVGIDFYYKGIFEKEERKGKIYLKTEQSKAVLKLTNTKRVYWQLDNLFNSDPRLGPEMNQFLNENWQDAFKEVQEAIEKAAAFYICNYYVNGFLHFVPTDDLFD